MAYYYNGPPYVPCPYSPDWGYPVMFCRPPFQPPQPRGRAPRNQRGRSRPLMEYQRSLWPAPFGYPAPAGAYLHSYPGGLDYSQASMNCPGRQQPNKSGTGQQGFSEGAPAQRMTDAAQSKGQSNKNQNKNDMTASGSQECPAPEQTQNLAVCQSNDTKTFNHASDDSSCQFAINGATDVVGDPSYSWLDHPQLSLESRYLDTQPSNLSMPTFTDLIAPSTAAYERHPRVVEDRESSTAAYECHPGFVDREASTAADSLSQLLFPDIAADYGYPAYGSFTVEPGYQNDEAIDMLEPIYRNLANESAISGKVAVINQGAKNDHFQYEEAICVDVQETCQDKIVTSEIERFDENRTESTERIEFSNAKMSERAYDTSLCEFRGPQEAEVNLPSGSNAFVENDMKTVNEVDEQPTSHDLSFDPDNSAAAPIQNSTVTSFSAGSDSSQLDSFLAQCLGSELSMELLDNCLNDLGLDVGEVVVGAVVDFSDDPMLSESQNFSDRLGGDDVLLPDWTAANQMPDIGRDGQDLKLPCRDTSAQTELGFEESFPQTKVKAKRVSRKARTNNAGADTGKEEETHASIIEKISAFQKESHHAIAKIIHKAVEKSISNISVSLADAFYRALAQRKQAIENIKGTMPITVHLPIRDLQCQTPNQLTRMEKQHSTCVGSAIEMRPNDVLKPDDEAIGMWRSLHECTNIACGDVYCSNQKLLKVTDIRDFFPKSESRSRPDSKPSQDSDGQTESKSTLPDQEGDSHKSTTHSQSGKLPEESSSASLIVSQGTSTEISSCAFIDNIAGPVRNHCSKRRSRSNRKTAVTDGQHDSLQNDASNQNEDLNDIMKCKSSHDDTDDSSMQQQKRPCNDPPKTKNPETDENDVAEKKCSEFATKLIEEETTDEVDDLGQITDGQLDSLQNDVSIHNEDINDITNRKSPHDDADESTMQQQKRPCNDPQKTKNPRTDEDDVVEKNCSESVTEMIKEETTNKDGDLGLRTDGQHDPLQNDASNHNEDLNDTTKRKLPHDDADDSSMQQQKRPCNDPPKTKHPGTDEDDVAESATEMIKEETTDEDDDSGPSTDGQLDSLQNDASNQNEDLNITKRKSSHDDADESSMQQQKQPCNDPPKTNHPGTDEDDEKICTESATDMIKEKTMEKDEDLGPSRLAKRQKDDDEEAALFEGSPSSVPTVVTYKERKRYNLRK